MHVSVSDAKAQLTELVRRAEAGEEIVLTRRGRPAARLVPEGPRQDPEAFDAAVQKIIDEARASPSPGPCAARSQDFLYDEDGLPA